MSVGKSALKAAGITAGVAAGVAGGVYAAQRTIARGLDHRPDPDAGRLGPLTFDETRNLSSYDGGSIYTVARGAATDPPIVLVHGVTLSSRVWVKQFDALPKAGVRVLAYDGRGHGQSTAGQTGHSIEGLGRDLATVLEGLDLHDAVVVGHSMGGIAVQELAIRHPDVVRDRVRGIVLLSTLARTPVLGGRGSGDREHATGLLGIVQRASASLSLASLMARPDVGTMLARIGFGREPKASHVELTRELLATCDPETSRDAVNALLELDLTSELGKISVPTLVIGGTADVITPPRESRRIASLIPGARLELFERAGHMLMLERTEELDEAILDFARDVGTLPTAHAVGM